MKNIIAITAIAYVLSIGNSIGADKSKIFSRDFNSVDKKDKYVGLVKHSEKGVTGQALVLDGLSSYIESSSQKVTKIKDGFTVEAWVALQEHPWNWSAIFDTYKDDKGIFFGVDAKGQLGLFVGNGSETFKCISTTKIKHLDWTHVAATFDAKQGLSVYINGKKSGTQEFSGTYTASENVNIWLGRSHKDTFPENTEREVCMQYDSKMILDGLLDEINVYSASLGDDEIAMLYDNLTPANPTPLEWRRMPKGPEDLPNRFSAYTTRLYYNDEWESLWRVSDDADIVVTFKDSKVRLLFWRGVNYGLTWVTENDIFTSNQSMEYYKEEAGCIEHMADKQCRYSHVRILEKSKARIVVHWRYALTSVEYGFPSYDTNTNWGDWGDEYITIYPDGVAVRKQTLHSHRFEKTWNDEISDGQDTHYQFNETFVFTQPGQSPYDLIEEDGLTLSTLDGDAYTYGIKRGDEHNTYRSEDHLVKLVNSKSDNKQFAIFEPGSSVQSWIENDYFTWNHWPVAQLPSDGRFSLANDRPAHTALSNGAPIWKSEGIQHTAVSLTGMNDMTIEELAAVGKSWNFAPDVSSSNEKMDVLEYSKYERAYILDNKDGGTLNNTNLEFGASANKPFNSLAIRIQNVTDDSYSFAINNEKQEIPYYLKETPSGYDLIAWVNYTSSVPFTLNIQNNIN